MEEDYQIFLAVAPATDPFPGLIRIYTDAISMTVQMVNAAGQNDDGSIDMFWMDDDEDDVEFTYSLN